ncbi:DUF4166 domain-containing protein [Labedella endophytica]|uniref:DUF4166 domain-containing protein n=1 Tax=Labedella endophytica TaxID=1523160 RepID=A0A3S1CSW7_9MICO|nr:DUF4166 domain-containing protein [Labedella endophytica]RUR01715.1 DUF4166 domain-containing protein [Labedella endophytica]
MAEKSAADVDAAVDADPRQSVYQRVLGPEYASLDPRLQQYFGPIPAGWVGSGSGVYRVAGSRHLFLRPVLTVMAWRHVLFPELGHDVPFGVVNTPSTDGGLGAVRTFEFLRRTRIMEDAMVVQGDRLYDRLGKRGGLGVAIRLSVVSGALHMTSTALALHIGRVRIPLPPLATMHLREHIGEAETARQQVDVRIDAPILGEVFRYTGSFVYSVGPATGSGV